MLLLVEFNAVVLSPDDYGVLGHRPVHSRTYFAARLDLDRGLHRLHGAVALAVLPAICFAFWRRLGLAGLGGDVRRRPSLQRRRPRSSSLRATAVVLRGASRTGCAARVLSAALLGDRFLRGLLPLLDARV